MLGLAFLPPAGTSARTLGGQLFWQIPGGIPAILSAEWLETAPSSNVFTCQNPRTRQSDHRTLKVVSTEITDPGTPVSDSLRVLAAPLSLRVTLPTAMATRFQSSAGAQVWLNSTNLELQPASATFDPSPLPSGYTRLYATKPGQTTPAVFTISPKHPSDDTPLVPDGSSVKFRTELIAGQTAYEEERPVVHHITGTPEEGAGDPPGPDPPYTVEEVRFIYEMTYGEAAGKQLAFFENGGLLIYISETNWWIDPYDYTFENISPASQLLGWGAPTLGLSRKELPTSFEAATALWRAVNELVELSTNDTSGDICASLRNTTWDQTLESWYYSDAGENWPQIKQALLRGSQTAFSETLSAFTGSMASVASFTNVGGIAVLAWDAGGAVAQGDATMPAVVFGSIFTGIAGKNLYKAILKRNISKLILKMPNGVLIELGREAVLALSNCSYKRDFRREAIAALRPLITEGKVTRSQMIKMFDHGILDSTRGSASKNLAYYLGTPKPGITDPRPHHYYPHKFEDDFVAAGIDINDGAEAGVWLSQKFHEIVHGAGSKGWPDGDPWNYQWELFFRPVPAPANPTPKSADQIIAFKDQLVDLIKNRHQTAEDIAWPKAKP